MSENNQIWYQILKKIEQQSMSYASFNTWYKDMTLDEIDNENKILYTLVPTDFIKNMLANNKIQQDLIKKCIKEVLNDDYSIQINTISSESKFNNKTDYHDNLNNLPKVRLNSKYTFENFVVGKSNEFAHAASLAVAENFKDPSGAHSNPLFIYGGVGLGKTHLMQAIGHFVLSQDSSKKILYVTSEQFTNELINSIQTNKNESFRNKYRKVDFLLIDDIQFIADKDRTQEEFFHTFNELHESNKQIILTSDKPPKDIKALEERLISRFAWGLVVDIVPPDLETRIAILRSKAESEGFNVSDNIIDFIARNVKSNIRELEGSLSKVMAYSKLTSELTEETAAIVLKDIYNSKKKKIINVDLIKNIVSKEYNISLEDLDSKKRNKHISNPRQIAMYISRELTDLSLPRIGEEFGGRDHSTVIHAYNKIIDDLNNDTALKIKINEIIKKIKK